MLANIHLHSLSFKSISLSLLRITLALLAVGLLMIICALASLGTESGRLFWLKHGLMLVQNDQLSIVLDQPRWPSLNRLEINYVLISTNRQPSLELTGAVLDVALVPLLQKRLLVHTLSTKSLVFYRPAKKAKPAAKEPFSFALNIPNIPPVHIERVAIAGIRLQNYNWELPKPAVEASVSSFGSSSSAASTSSAHSTSASTSISTSISTSSVSSSSIPKPSAKPNTHSQNADKTHAKKRENTPAITFNSSSKVWGVPASARFRLEGSVAINWPNKASSPLANLQALNAPQNIGAAQKKSPNGLQTLPLQLALTLNEAGNNTPIVQLTGTSEQANTLNVQGGVQHPAGGWLAELMRLPSNLPVNARLNVTSTHEHAKAPIHIELHDFFAPVFTQKIGLNGRLNIDTIAKQITLSQLNLSINQQQHTFSGSISKHQLALNTALNDFDLAIIKPWLKGLKSGTVNVQSQLTWDWNTQHLPTGNIHLKSQANYQQQAVTLNSQLQLNPNTLQIKQLRARLGEAKLSVKGRLHTQGKPHALTFTLTHLRDKPLRALLPPSLAKHLPKPLSFHAQRIGGLIRGTAAKPKVIADVNILGNYQGTPFAIYGSANGSHQHADIHNLTAEAQDAVFSINGMVDWVGNNTQLTGRIKHLSPAIAYKHNLPLPPNIVGFINADWQLSGPLKAPKASVDALFQGGYEHQSQVLPFKLKLAASTQVGNINSMTVNIDELRLATFTKPLVSLKGRIGAQDNDLRLVVSRLPVELFEVLGLPIGEGRAEARMRLTGSYIAPKLVGYVSYGETIAIRDTRNNRSEVPLIWHANINSESNNLIVDSSFTLDKTSAGQMAINVPWHNYLNYALSKNGGDMPTRGSITANVNTSALQLFLDTDQTVIEGELVSDINIAGTAKTPIATGELLFKNGYFRQAATGTVLSEIQLYALAQSQRIDLVTGFARDGEGGTVKALGYVDWSNPKSATAVDLTLRAKDAHLVSMPNVNGSVSGDVNVKGGMKGLELTGRLDVRPLNINIDTTPAASIPKLDVKEIYKEQTQTAAKASNLPDINLDIAIDIEQQAYIRGRGLTAEIAGTVNITGTAAEPDITGSFKTLRGDIKLLQKPLVLNEGRARFSNDALSFNIPATYNTGEHEITLIVSGTEEAIKMDLSSVPSLPQEEILARLLFGNSVQNISPFEAITLASAINTLSNGSSFDPLNTTREKLGFDSLRIGQDTEDNGGGVNVGVGKYLNERVYLELERSSNPVQPWQGNLRIDVTKEVRLNSTTGSAGKTSAALEWRRDY